MPPATASSSTPATAGQSFEHREQAKGAWCRPAHVSQYELAIPVGVSPGGRFQYCVEADGEVFLACCPPGKSGGDTMVIPNPVRAAMYERLE